MQKILTLLGNSENVRTTCAGSYSLMRSVMKFSVMLGDLIVHVSS